MKILFLDVDGVLNCQETFTKDPNQHFPIDKYMAFLVGKIQIETDCKIVLSSSWRHHNASVDHIRTRVCNIYDLTGDEPYDPDKPGVEGCQRGREIKKWLELSKYKIEKYAILDDDSDMLLEQLPNFFKTDWKIGLTDEIALKVIKHLNENNTNS